MFSRVKTLFASIPKSKFVTAAKYSYFSMIAIGGCYGAGHGFSDWCEWENKRNSIKFSQFKFLEPVVNGSYSAGSLTYHVLSTGIPSALTSATFPISVPILMLLFEDKNKTEEDKTNEKSSE